MSVKVVDASALAAIIFEEPERREIAHRLEEAALVAPPLLGFEIVNACLAKMRRHPQLRHRILHAFDLSRGLMIEPVEVEHAAVLDLAERTGLTGYDASYLWLAQRFGAELVTLDRELARAAAMLRPG